MSDETQDEAGVVATGANLLGLILLMLFVLLVAFPLLGASTLPQNGPRTTAPVARTTPQPRNGEIKADIFGSTHWPEIMATRRAR